MSDVGTAMLAYLHGKGMPPLEYTKSDHAVRFSAVDGFRFYVSIDTARLLGPHGLCDLVLVEWEKYAGATPTPKAAHPSSSSAGDDRGQGSSPALPPSGV